MSNYTNIDRLFHGSIDMHLHHGPDGGPIPRRLDALETARQAQQSGMRAIVLKSHQYPTAPLAALISQLVPEVKVFGSICLDYEMGGLNFHAVEASARLGAKVVWMPTFSSANSIGKISRLLNMELEGEGFSILGASGKLVPEIDRILSLVKEYDMVLATGHISPAETFRLVEEARRRGIWKLVITHANEANAVELPLSLEDQQRLAGTGAFIEYIGASLLPTVFREDPVEMVRAMRRIGAEHIIVSTDLGQLWNPLPAEGMRLFIATMLKNGMTEEEIELMARSNPARLLGLD